MVRHFFRANFRLLNRFRGTQYVSSTTGYGTLVPLYVAN